MASALQRKQPAAAWALGWCFAAKHTMGALEGAFIQILDENTKFVPPSPMDSLWTTEEPRLG